VLTRGRSVFTPLFLSRLEPIFSRYVNLKRALGRRFDTSARCNPWTDSSRSTAHNTRT